jgi:Arrestin (or S-antigen), N-terminal domain
MYHVRLLPRPIQCHCLKLSSIPPTASLKFKGYHQILEKFPETSVVDSLSTVQADICETQVTLISPNSSLSAGQHEIPFSLSIPGNLPQSFENTSGHLRYEFTVTARESSNWLNLESHKYKRQIQVHRHYIPSLEEAPFLDPRVTFSKRQSRSFDINLEYPSVVPVEQHGFSVFGNIAPLGRRGIPAKVIATLKQVKETR